MPGRWSGVGWDAVGEGSVLAGLVSGTDRGKKEDGRYTLN